MFKWLKTEFKNQRLYEITLALAVGCLIGFVAGGISSDWVIVAGANWWDVMVAFGTVGAVVVALSQALRLSNLKRDEDRAKLEGMLSIVSEAVDNLNWISDHLSCVNNEKADLNLHQVRSFLGSMAVVDRIPFYEFPYCVCHKDLNPVLLKLQLSIPGIELILSSKGACVNLEDLKKKADDSSSLFHSACKSPKFKGVTLPGPHYVSPRLLD